jgi:hypothetical protein
MDDDFDILALLEEKSRDELISEAVDKLPSVINSPINPELSYSIDLIDFKEWLNVEGFILEIKEDSTIDDSDIDKIIYQCAIEFVYKDC